MAVSALNENKIFYDPYYRPDIAGSPAGIHARLSFDDFTLSEHLHILNPQFASVDPAGVLHDRMRCHSRILRKSLTMVPHERSSAVSLSRRASAGKTLPGSQEAEALYTQGDENVRS